MMKRHVILLVLASDPVTVWPTRAAVLASGHAAGTEWRSEAIGFNPYANLPALRQAQGDRLQIGVRFTALRQAQGERCQVVDYTVQVTDANGTFTVWARSLDRILGLAGLSGSSGFMTVKNYDMVKSSDHGKAFASGFNALKIEPGDLGMVFRDWNPVSIFAALAPILAGVPIAQSLMAVYQVVALADAAAWTAAAALRLAKGTGWALGANPLVIDLDGDGIVRQQPNLPNSANDNARAQNVLEAA